MTEPLWMLIGLAVGAVATWLLARRINAANAARIDVLTAAEDKARKAAEKLRRENEATKDAAATAKRLRGELDAMRARLDEATNPLQARIDALQADLARRDRQIMDYRSEIDEREHRMADLRSRLGMLDGSAAPTREAELTAELARAHAQASELSARAASESKRADDAAGRLEHESAGSLKHQARVKELKDAVDHLTRRFAERNRELEAAQKALAERDERLRQLRSGGQAAIAAPASPLDEKAANAKLVEAYRHDMKMRDRKIADLERALAKARRGERPQRAQESAAGAAAPNGEDRRAVQHPIGAASAAMDGTSAAAELGEQPASDGNGLMTAAAEPNGSAVAGAAAAMADAAESDGPADDLTRIKGIGKVFAARLAAAGIRSYADLAARAPDELAAVVEPKAWQAIDFDAWITAAREHAG